MSSKSSKTDAARGVPETVEVARIRRPHGVRGAVLVEVESDVEARFDSGARLLLKSPDGDLRALTVDSASPHGNGMLIRFAELSDRESVEELREHTLEVPREEVPAAPDGSWYFFELLGCRCRDRRLGDLGRVVEIVEDGGGVLMRVEAEDAGLLIPFTQASVLDVDVSDGVIQVDLPDGLVETCGYRS